MFRVLPQNLTALAFSSFCGHSSLLALSGLLAATLTTGAFAQWNTSVSADEMTGETTAYATSGWVSPRRQMSFPYGGVRAVMGVGCKGSSEWAYIRFTESPNPTNQTIGDGFTTIHTRVRWDEDVENTNFRQTWGAQSMQFRHSSRAISRIESSNSALLEIGWYGSGNVYFDFSLAGSTAAIAEARQHCRSSN